MVGEPVNFETADTTDYKKLLTKNYEHLRGDALLNAPVEAISGISANDAAALKSSFGIDTIGELADSPVLGKARILAKAAREQQADISESVEWIFDESTPMAAPDDVEDEIPSDDAPPTLETVIGTDERVTVDPLGPTFETICYLGLTASNGKRFRGTGFYINFGGQAALLTAAHCLYSRRHGGYMRTVKVIRGRSGRTMPFGIQTVDSSKLRVPDIWKTSSPHEHDWGVIIMGGTPWGLGCSALADSDLYQKTIRTAGYPGDKRGYKMWYDDGPVTKATQRKIYYMEDTAGGQSGSPVWAKVPGTTYWDAVGIHAYGRSFSGNSATRITQDILNQINEWTK